MAVVASRRSVITLYSGSKDLYSHRTRIVLAEKGVGVDIIEVDVDNKPEELLEINPYGTVPTLIDRDLVLYRTRQFARHQETWFRGLTECRMVDLEKDFETSGTVDRLLELAKTVS